MALYRIGVCVVESNPNFNDAHRFANRHPGHVFLCSSYGTLPDDMVQWGDRGKLGSSDRRTDEDDRVRYSVRIDQVRCMQSSLAQFTPDKPLTIFPDPNELEQEVVDNHVRQRALVAPRAFQHFTKTALVMERDEETNRYRRTVKKVGIDPHFSYANLLCDVALARAHGTATFILPTARGAPEVEKRNELNPMLAQLPGAIQHLMEPLPPGEVCGRCVTFPLGDEGERPSQAHCPHQNATVQATQPGCPIWVSADDDIDDPE